MPREFIRKREYIKNYRYSLFFADEGSRGLSGFAFECDEDGNVTEDFSKKESARKSYEGCVKGQVGDRKFGPPQIQKMDYSYWCPASIRCSCGAEVVLELPSKYYSCDVNTCDCGKDYNGSGQLLAPRSQWGEETGETYVDIMNGNNHSWDSDY